MVEALTLGLESNVSIPRVDLAQTFYKLPTSPPPLVHSAAHARPPGQVALSVTLNTQQEVALSVTLNTQQGLDSTFCYTQHTARFR